MVLKLHIHIQTYGEQMQQGELIVTGHDQIKLKLKFRPEQISVHFKDHQVIVPCNHHHHDELEYEVFKIKRTYYLLISWKVSNVRTISWKVCR